MYKNGNKHIGYDVVQKYMMMIGKLKEILDKYRSLGDHGKINTHRGSTADQI